MVSEIEKLLKVEEKRQKEVINLIASENYVSKDVLCLLGSVFTNKYAEGYPQKRFYQGCSNYDQAEELAISYAKKLFNAEHANVQPHSGCQANYAVYHALLNDKDKVLAMDLNAGGHLSHGSEISFSGKHFQFFHYGVNSKTNSLDYDEIKRIAVKVRPKLIIAGASSYPLTIDFQKFSLIAKEINAYLLVDMAHISGLVAAGLHQNPCLFADVVTSTTHKTLRGPRGGIILCRKEHSKKIDSAVFPGIQGGPHMNNILAKAQAFAEALTSEFKIYQKAVVDNCQILASTLLKLGVKLIANGTENHLLLINTKLSFGLTGKEAAEILEKIGIIANKNVIPFEQETPFVTSGLRLGSPAMTTFGFQKKEFQKLGKLIFSVLSTPTRENIFEKQKEVLSLLKDGVRK
jgi:glycine hydroxymethyltransferase